MVRLKKENNYNLLDGISEVPENYDNNQPIGGNFDRVCSRFNDFDGEGTY